MPSNDPAFAWAQFRAALAAEQSAWWGDFQGTVSVNTYMANLSAFAYQAQVDAAYLLAAGTAPTPIPDGLRHSA